MRMRNMFRVVAGLVVVGVFALALAAGKAAEVLKSINDYRASLLKEVRDSGKPMTQQEFDGIQAKVKAKALESIKDVDPKKVDSAEAYDWAMVFSAAGKLSDARDLLRQSLTVASTPDRQFQANMSLVTFSSQLGDMKGAYEALNSAKSYDQNSALALASYAANYAEELVHTVGKDKVLTLLTNAENNLPASMTDERAAPRLASTKRALGATKLRLNMIGAPAPSISMEKGYGEFKGLEAYKGKVLLIDFFAHWCGPCKASYPDMRKMYDELKGQGLEIIGVTRYYGYYGRDNYEKRDMPQDVEYGKMADFIKEFNINWPVIYGDQKNFEAYGVTGIPHVTVIDRKGNVHKVEVGYSPELFKKFRAEIEKLLKE